MREERRSRGRRQDGRCPPRFEVNISTAARGSPSSLCKPSVPSLCCLFVEIRHRIAVGTRAGKTRRWLLRVRPPRQTWGSRVRGGVTPVSAYLSTVSDKLFFRESLSSWSRGGSISVSHLILTTPRPRLCKCLGILHSPIVKPRRMETSRMQHAASLSSARREIYYFKLVRITVFVSDGLPEGDGALASKPESEG